jgi:hypothetical protein
MVLRKQPKRGSSQDGREEHSYSGHASLQALVISKLSGCCGNSYPVIAVSGAEASGKALRCVADPFASFAVAQSLRGGSSALSASLNRSGQAPFALSAALSRSGQAVCWRTLDSAGPLTPASLDELRRTLASFSAGAGISRAGSQQCRCSAPDAFTRCLHRLNSADVRDDANGEPRASPPLPHRPAFLALAPAQSHTPVQTADQRTPHQRAVLEWINAESLPAEQGG